MSLPDAGFDRVAPVYDLLARLVFGRALQQAQQAALRGLPEGEPRVLIIGGGSGWIIGEVLRLRPQASILYLEASPAMLTRSRQVVAGLTPEAGRQVELRLGTEDFLKAEETFDAVLTFFFLDLFEPLRLGHILRRLHRALRPGAAWLLADFCPPKRFWQKGLLTMMYRFFRLTTGISGHAIPDLRAELTRLGLSAGPAEQFYGGLVAGSIFRMAPRTIPAPVAEPA
ncbi:class I SAM-dependent methyltransferase [Hymenobacter sp. BT175]|uniref:class I SAM-dependent methyltransferase n=1 Tax=Hymenobacter translucens TaxID=2886507 RepID=UPI001D0ED187|nr:class I SAM-dependent methyltransferase [Hymenobacter translucens]MCC2548134.1 class I SAM-dependent methyltransferase [Hymenobacter translucens]